MECDDHTLRNLIIIGYEHVALWVFRHVTFSFVSV